MEGSAPHPFLCAQSRPRTHAPCRSAHRLCIPAELRILQSPRSEIYGGLAFRSGTPSSHTHALVFRPPGSYGEQNILIPPCCNAHLSEEQRWSRHSLYIPTIVNKSSSVVSQLQSPKVPSQPGDTSNLNSKVAVVSIGKVHIIVCPPGEISRLSIRDL